MIMASMKVCKISESQSISAIMAHVKIMKIMAM
jgi:hypothetical protein